VANGSVELQLDWATLSAEADPVSHIVGKAVSEVTLTKDYNTSEADFLKQDPILKDSARRAYLHIRKKATRVPHDQYKAQKSGKEFVTPPTQYRVTLHYSHPASRGWMDREV
jgi:hypothetical protein